MRIQLICELSFCSKGQNDDDKRDFATKVLFVMNFVQCASSWRLLLLFDTLVLKYGRNKSAFVVSDVPSSFCSFYFAAPATYLRLERKGSAYTNSGMQKKNRYPYRYIYSCTERYFPMLYTYSDSFRSMDEISEFIIHCTSYED